MKNNKGKFLWTTVALIAIVLVVCIMKIGTAFTEYAETKYQNTQISNCDYIGQQFDAPAKYIQTYGCYLFQDGKWSLIK